MKLGAKSPAFLATAILLAVGILVLMTESEPVIGALFFVPFALGPLLVSLAIATKSPYLSCQIILTVGSVLYGTWFGFVFLDAFYWHVDPQSAIALLFIGIYSLPIMIPIWLTTLALRRRNKMQSEPISGDQ
jgi:CDP-diglyceride synthetase